MTVPITVRWADGDVSGLRVLDLGCGAGHYADELLRRGAGRVVGVEGSETLRRAARPTARRTTACSAARRNSPGLHPPHQ
ncbi:methyltransferase domain-containing protein [Streptomyces griseus]|uniref:methyltransferase domain-containing protein n=1 Tax=Streptomyces griseus TaxID=1911 RepID=UPI0018FEDF82|nr:methyltransferase domain-containing protein [Streptomyces griseus]